MDCPLCGSDDVHRDYAPARSYALLLLALGLLFAGRFLAPSATAYPGELGRLVILGVVVGLFGLFDTFGHQNRYCGYCGYRFRARSRRHAGAATPLRRMESAESPGRAGPPEDRPGAKYIRGLASHKTTDGETDELDPNTPIEPILACLKFKDEKMRREATNTLRRLTGQDFGEDTEAWKQWYAENKDAYWAERRKR